MSLTTASKLRLRSYGLLIGSAVSLTLSLAYLFGPLIPLESVANDEGWISQAARLVAQDQHYKYLVPLLVPVGSYFVIANWIAFEFFRYA